MLINSTGKIDCLALRQLAFGAFQAN